MAELYQAYGLDNDSYGGGGSGSFFEEEPPQEKPKQRESRNHAPSHAPQHHEHHEHQQHSNKHQAVKEDFQNSPPYELKNYEKHDVVKRNVSYSFWDRMAMKRPEVIKLGVFALVIVLAIALERIGTHYLTKYLADNLLTDLQEFMLRLSYPILVFLVIWIIKSM